MRGVPTCFGFPQPSSGSYYMWCAKRRIWTDINNYNFSKSHIVAPWWWLWKTETCRSTSRVNFNVNFNIILEQSNCASVG